MEVVAKMPTGNRHASCVKRLNRLFGTLVGDRAIVSVHDPIRLADSEPEPDVALLVRRDDFYASAKPGPTDVLLLIEVGDASLDDDREVKRPLYAEAGIAEYWIVNLVDGCLEVHRTLRPGDRIDVAALAGVAVGVGDLV